ncbi:hypothetical protein MOTE_10150 [Moorella thermoacetica]|uniref:Flp/Fap pilin component n=1 Tax=Neomoorella thermoacetica TaxID=1525 RepID=A0A1J5NVH5_NEOTH|nr:hypothetical protein MOTE_10150 [Moorella thermoacetica]
MFAALKKLVLEEKGSTFIESGLWIAIVVLVMATAGYNLANTMKDKFTGISNTVNSISIPTIR